MPVTIHVLTVEAEQRAEEIRELLAQAKAEVASGERKRPRRIKAGFALSDRCDTPGIEGVVKEVSVTGAIIFVVDAQTRETIEIPNADIVSWEKL